jgi:hypothetical protein
MYVFFLSLFQMFLSFKLVTLTSMVVSAASLPPSPTASPTVTPSTALTFSYSYPMTRSFYSYPMTHSFSHSYQPEPTMPSANPTEAPSSAARVEVSVSLTIAADTAPTDAQKTQLKTTIAARPVSMRGS